MCRPENLTVSASPLEGGNTFRAKVSHTYFLGNVADVYLQAGRLQLRAQLSPPEMFEEGQDLWIQVAPKSLLLFPRKDN